MSVQGVSGLQKRWNTIFPAKLKRRVQVAMEKGADEIVEYMIVLVGKDEFLLMNSIGWTWGRPPKGSITIGEVQTASPDDFRITIFAGNENTVVTNSRGVRFQNALLQEFGTKNRSANPFFFVAYRTRRRRARNRITAAARKAIREDS